MINYDDVSLLGVSMGGNSLEETLFLDQSEAVVFWWSSYLYFLGTIFLFQYPSNDMA